MGILDRIQELCKKKGINPSRLEVELDFGKGTLYKWDKSSPSTDKANRVAEYFGVSVDYLLGKTNNPDINKSYDDIPDEAKEELNNFIEYLKAKYKKQ